MISHVLSRLAVLDHETDGAIDIDVATETVIENVDRKVSTDERDDLKSLLPEWLESDLVSTTSKRDEQ